MNRGEEEKQAKAIELMVWRDENHMRGLFGLAGVLWLDKNASVYLLSSKRRAKNHFLLKI
jgi:hypothetical protein